MSRSLEAMLKRLADAASRGRGLDGPFRELGRSADSAAWRSMASEIAASLDAGNTLGTALERHGTLIPARVRRVLGLAETEGNLARALDALLVESEVTSRLRARLRSALLGPASSFAIASIGLGIGAAMAVPEAASWFTFWQFTPDGLIASTLAALGSLPRVFWVALGAAPALWLALVYRRAQRFERLSPTGLLAPVLRGLQAIVSLLDARLMLARGADVDPVALEGALTPLARCVFASAFPARGPGLAIDDALATAREEFDVTARRHASRLALGLTAVTGIVVLSAGYALLQWQLSMLDAPLTGVLP